MTSRTAPGPATEDEVAPASDTDQSKEPVALTRVFGWRDLVTPAGCALIVLAEMLYIKSLDLDRTEINLLKADLLVSQTLEHVYLSATIALLVIAIAVPLGVLVTRKPTQWLSPIVLGVANLGQAAPSVGLIAIIGGYAIGFWAVVSILTAYASLAVLRNTIVGLQGVDRGVLDAARGMGVSNAGLLFRIELPLAVPIIAAGARTALVLAVATVPFGQFLDAGGLGFTLFGAYKNDRFVALFASALFIALLALLLDWVGGLLQRALTPRGIR
ncbi:MAG: ABC transporter permease [Nocardioidaceae bacterium]